MTENMKKFITEQLAKENVSPQDLLDAFAETVNEVTAEQQKAEDKKNADINENLRIASDALVSCAEAMSNGDCSDAVTDLFGVDSLRFILQMALDVTSREYSLEQALGLMFDPFAMMKDIEDMEHKYGYTKCDCGKDCHRKDEDKKLVDNADDIIAEHLKKLFGC